MSNFWKNKKVAVTGASGFIGIFVVKALIEKNAKVTAIVSPASQKKELETKFKGILPLSSIRKADLTILSSCQRAIRGCEVILNLAALDGGQLYKKEHKAEMFRINSMITLNVLEAAVKEQVKRVLIMSSIEVYPQKKSGILKENYSLKENFNEAAHGYTWAKRFGEIAAKLYAEEYGLEIAIARAGNIYGPGDYSTKGRVIPTFIQQALEGKDITIWGDGQQRKSFLYVSDAAQALVDLTEKYAICSPINIAGEKKITLKQLAHLVINIARSSSSIKLIPYDSSKGAIVSILKAKKEIGLKEKISIQQGLRETIAYFKKLS